MDFFTQLSDKAVLKYEKLVVQQYQKVDEIPFDFSRKIMSVVVDVDGKHRIITKGAPEEVFKRCTKYVLDEELPDDLDTSDRYLVVPHKTELDLGKDLALRFAAREIPDYSEQVASIFRSKGAYGRFKQLSEDKGVLEKWYKFEEEATEKALREWCAANDIQIVESSASSAA